VRCARHHRGFDSAFGFRAFPGARATTTHAGQRVARSANTASRRGESRRWRGRLAKGRVGADRHLARDVCALKTKHRERTPQRNDAGLACEASRGAPLSTRHAVHHGHPRARVARCGVAHRTCAVTRAARASAHVTLRRRKSAHEAGQPGTAAERHDQRGQDNAEPASGIARAHRSSVVILEPAASFCKRQAESLVSWSCVSPDRVGPSTPQSERGRAHGARRGCNDTSSACSLADRIFRP
jgi:hypothetical protein